MSPEVSIHADLEALSAAAAQWMGERLREALRARGRCDLALAGGSTPVRAYGRLANVPGVDWEQVHFWFGDERCVPSDHPDSNYRMARVALFEPLGAPAPVHRMRGEDPDPERAAREYAAELPERLDVLVLGMGADGHTASLFPGSPALHEHRRLVVVADGPEPPERRLTITPPVIANAAHVLVLAAGVGKARTAQRALEGPPDPDRLPVQLALRGTWMLDRAAAAALTRVGS